MVCPGLDHFGFSPKGCSCESAASTVLGCETLVNGFKMGVETDKKVKLDLLFVDLLLQLTHKELWF